MSAVQDHLDRFYVELQAWIDGGMARGSVFATHKSICGAALAWQKKHAPDLQGIWTLWDAIGKQFASAGLHTKHPFNDGDFKKWEFESDCGRLYTNPARLAWIKEHAEAALARRAAGEAAA
jgi:hypothetical protein